MLHPYLGEVAIWPQPWRASDTTSDVVGLSLLMKPSEHESIVQMKKPWPLMNPGNDEICQLFYTCILARWPYGRSHGGHRISHLMLLVMETPDTTEKENKEFTTEQENKVSSGHHSPTTTRKHVRLGELFESSSRFAKRKRTPIEDFRTSQVLPDIEPVITGNLPRVNVVLRFSVLSGKFSRDLRKLVTQRAYLVGTDTESEPFEDLGTESLESPHVVASPISFPDSTPPICHVEESEGFGTSSTGSTSSYSTIPLSPDHLLTRDTPILVPSLCRTARMAVHVQPVLSPGYSVHIAEASSMSDVAFHKRNELVDERFFGSESGSEDAEMRVLLRGDEDPGLAINWDWFMGPEIPEKSAAEEDQSIIPLLVATPTATIPVDEDQFIEVGAQLELYRIRDEIFSQRYRLRSLEQEQERAVMTFGALWRLVLALETWIGHVDTRMGNMSRAGYDDHRLVHDLLVQQTSLQHELQEMRGRVTALEQERDRGEQLSVESDGLGLEEEDEAVPEGQQLAAPVVEKTVGEPLGLGYRALRRRELAAEEDQRYHTFEVGQGSGSAPEPERSERVSAFRQPALTTWTDSEDGTVYIDVPTYPPLAPPVQTPPSPDWTPRLLPISPSHSDVPSPVLSPLISLIIPSPVATPTATIPVDEDHFIERPVLALETWAGHVDTRMANMSRAGYDDHRLVHDLLVQQTSLQHELQEMRGCVTALEQERDRGEQ
ncbi:hypothetical protein Tco_0507926 [Tanacetum coccineum]